MEGGGVEERERGKSLNYWVVGGGGREGEGGSNPGR